METVLIVMICLAVIAAFGTILYTYLDTGRPLPDTKQQIRVYPVGDCRGCNWYLPCYNNDIARIPDLGKCLKVGTYCGTAKRKSGDNCGWSAIEFKKKG